jgi:hypothetical protein
MGLDPAKLSPLRQTKFIHVSGFSSMNAILAVQASGAIGTNMEIGLSADAATATLEGGTGITAERVLATNNPCRMRPEGSSSLIAAPVGSSDILAIQFTAAAPGPRHHMGIPSDWDRRHPIYVRAVWEHQLSSIGTEDVQWRFLYEAITSGATNILATTPASVLDTVIPVETPALPQGTWKRGSAGTMNAKSLLASSGTTHPFMLHFALGVGAMNNWSSAYPRLLGIEFEFTPRWGRSERQVEAQAYRA